MLTALRHPDRVQALVLVDAAIYGGGGAPSWVRPLLHTPQAKHLGPLLARSMRTFGERLARTAWHDPTRLTPEIWEGYRKPLQAENWDRALWELTLASHPLGLDRRLREVHVPVLVITGDDDRIVPTEQSIRLAGELPSAQLVVIPNCGHVPHEECPQVWMEAVTPFLEALP
jgi:pimeloyl-ACP methyl ester carboxylesterase